MSVQSETQPNPKIKARDYRGRNIRTAEQIRLDNQAADLRRNHSYREIAELMGLESDHPAQLAYEMVQRAIAEIPRESTEALVQIELGKLDAIEAMYAEIAQKHHVYVTQAGKVVYDGAERLQDDGPAMTALAGLLKVGERRAKLLGLNAPTNIRLEVVSYDTDAIDAEFDEFKRALDAGLGDSQALLDEQEGQTGTATA